MPHTLKLSVLSSFLLLALVSCSAGTANVPKPDSTPAAIAT